MLAQAPDYEQALDERVTLALELGEATLCPVPALRAVAVNPWSAQFHERLAHYQVESGNWNEAAREAGEALRLNPFPRLSRGVSGPVPSSWQGPPAGDRRIQDPYHGQIPPIASTWQLWFARERREVRGQPCEGRNSITLSSLAHHQASSLETRFPYTSVSRNCLPWNLNVSRVWSRPSK